MVLVVFLWFSLFWLLLVGPPGAPPAIRFLCFSVVLVVFAVAGNVPRGTHYHQTIVLLPVFGGFDGFGFFFVVLMLLVVAGRASWGTPCHFGGFGGFGFCFRGFACCW